MAFEHIINPLLNAGMIEQYNTEQVYLYTHKALNKIDNTKELSWHFCSIFSTDGEYATATMWLPDIKHTDDNGNSCGGFNDIEHYRYIKVNNLPNELFNTMFEDCVKILFKGLGVPYISNEEDYVDLNDIIF